MIPSPDYPNRKSGRSASLKLCVDLAQIAVIHEFVGQVGRDQELDDETLHALHLVVGEACTNVIEHAYDGRGGPIEITLEAHDDQVRVVVRDSGVAFDPADVAVPDITAPLDQRPLGGLGVYLMQQTMDEVHYDFSAEDGNTLIMVKRNQRVQGPADQGPQEQVP